MNQLELDGTRDSSLTSVATGAHEGSSSVLQEAPRT